MQAPHNPEDSYRLIVTRRKASEILLSQDGSGWKLPRVGIRPRQRVAEQLVSELHGEWGLETYCLFVPNAGTSAPNGAETKCAVMESVRHNDEAPAGTCWMPPSTAADCSDAREAAAIRPDRRENLHCICGACHGHKLQADHKLCIGDKLGYLEILRTHHLDLGRAERALALFGL